MGQLISTLICISVTAPQAPYPTQFRQANAALHHVLNSGFSPSNILLSGDSAGAHIALCLVSHLLHPHRLVNSPPTLSTPLAGLLLISPRVTNNTTSASFAENSARDTLTKETLAGWIANFRANSILSTDEGLAGDEPYSEPLSASDDWWAGLATVVTRRVFISAGNHECFRDDIVSFSRTLMRCEGLDVRRVVEKKGIHDSPLMDVDAGRPPTDLIIEIGRWVTETLNGGKSRQ